MCDLIHQQCPVSQVAGSSGILLGPGRETGAVHGGLQKNNRNDASIPSAASCLAPSTRKNWVHFVD